MASSPVSHMLHYNNAGFLNLSAKGGHLEDELYSFATNAGIGAIHLLINVRYLGVYDNQQSTMATLQE
ncbi:hypothetical protein E2562_016840 [Oryza meyeriana var. granulata]|uniref:Uncharacterized protein n=1 Tax=Oryza meyeriana var. granulata TaxID=110450 RepID=A0A6G1BXP0_9ORYZ|nr:hypothetical protein E2562_016840 [Oryza meyeriana var. granulata]